jgi:hypothetical protein
LFRFEPKFFFVHFEDTLGNTIPAWGFRRFTVCFSGRNFEFNTLLGAVATPLLGMDFLTHFGLSIILLKQQVLHTARGPHFLQGKYFFFCNTMEL